MDGFVLKVELPRFLVQPAGNKALMLVVLIPVVSNLGKRSAGEPLPIHAAGQAGFPVGTHAVDMARNARTLVIHHFHLRGVRAVAIPVTEDQRPNLDPRIAPLAVNVADAPLVKLQRFLERNAGIPLQVARDLAHRGNGDLVAQFVIPLQHDLFSLRRGGRDHIQHPLPALQFFRQLVDAATDTREAAFKEAVKDVASEDNQFRL